MTPFSPELMQTLEDLIPAICVCIGLAIIVYIAFLNNALINARQTCKDQGNMLAEYVHLQADDLIKVQNAHKNEAAAMRKYNDLMREHDKWKLTADNLLKRKFELDTENKILKDKISRKNEPRDAKGHFIKTAAVKKNPNIGKYRCIDDSGMFNFGFTYGFVYKKYESKDSPVGHLILIGDDRMRSDVTHIANRFQLITE